MSKKTFTILFTIVSTIINMIITAAIIVALIILTSLFYFKVLKIQQPGTGLMFFWMFSFIIGLFSGMFVFSKVCGIIVDKFNFAEKLDPRIVGKYLPGGKKSAQYKEPEQKMKTNLPKPTLAVEDDEWARNIENGISASEDFTGAQEDLGSSSSAE